MLSVPRGAERRVNFSAVCRLIIAAGSGFPRGAQRSGSGEATVRTKGSSLRFAPVGMTGLEGKAWEPGVVWQTDVLARGDECNNDVTTVIICIAGFSANAPSSDL